MSAEQQASDEKKTGFVGLLIRLLDGGEFTIGPLLLGIATGAATGWRLAAGYLPGSEYILAAVGAVLGIFVGIVLAAGLVGLLLGWAIGWLAAFVLRTAFGVDLEAIVLVAKYAGAGIGALAGALCTVVAVTNTLSRGHEGK